MSEPFVRYEILKESASRTENGFSAIIVVQKEENNPVELCVMKEKENRYFISRRNIPAEEISLEEMLESEYADFFFIGCRMIRDLEGYYARTRYEVVQKRTRMVQNLYSKIPESEIEIAFMDGEHYYLFAYESNSFVEYGISRISWIDQGEEGYQVNRATDLIESYDSLQESLSSDFAGLFLELHEMMCNAEDFPDEFFEEYEEEALPGYYTYDEE